MKKNFFIHLPAKRISLIFLLWFFITDVKSQIWTELNTNSYDDLKAVYFIDDQTGWVAGENGAILKTTDGGTSWTPQTSGTTQTLRCLHFTDPNTGWAAGGQGVILKTTNGGGTWVTQTSNTTQQLNAIKFIDSNNGWATGGNTTVRKTTNGGTNWTTQTVTGANSGLWGLTLIDLQNLWLSGTSKTISRSTNGGTNWTNNTSLPVGPITTFNDILFTDINNGWLTGSGGEIFHTSNGSTGSPTWVLQNSGTTNDILNIEFLDNNTGWVCGRNGTILSTTNGGNSWSAEASGDSKTLWDIKFINDSTGWAVADSGYVIKYQKITTTAPLTLLQPTGGEVFQIGTVQNIIWYANGISNVKLEYSVTNGSSWLPITGANNLPSSPSSFSWTIPNTQTLTALVRISDVSNASVFDVSPATFYIQPVPVGKDYAVLLTASVNNSPAQITINWNNDPNALSYDIDRKLKQDTSWTFLANVPVAANSYTDLNINIGEAYEYRVTKTTIQLTAYGYIYAGLELPETDSRGEILLLVDNNFSSSLTAEINRMELDLIGDGYLVKKMDVDPSIGVTAIKNIITQEYTASSGLLSTVLTVGHFPAPYSGNFAPDGHSERVGAQPADGFYGDVDGVWTDNTVTTSNTGLIYTPNIPGDGKFDQSTFPSDIDLQVGRIDMDKMSGFALAEVDLIKQYLNKNHDFRLKNFDPNYRGLINSTFDILLPTTSAAAWRSFSTMFGSSVKEIFPCNSGCTEFIDSLENEDYLWTHMAGGGSDTSMTSDVFTSSYCINKPINTVFMQMYGSYFVEWYKGSVSTTTNHLLRAPMASNGTTLATVWSGKAPYWHFHHMALGETIGYSTLRNQNNLTTYSPGTTTLQKGIHMALMGDPTLKMHIVAPVTNVTITPGSNSIDVTWNTSVDNIVGYNIYRTDGLRNVFTKINTSLITSTAYTDNNPLNGNNVYMVRAVKLESRPGGTYYNMSTGIIDSATVALTVSEESKINSFSISPNPSDGNFTIELNADSASGFSLKIMNVIGEMIYSSSVYAQRGINLFPVDFTGHAEGIYTILLTAGGKTLIAEKIIVRN